MPPLRIVLEATALIGRRTGVGSYTAQLLTELPAALNRAGASAQVAATTWTARGGRLEGLPPTVLQVGPRLPARLLRAAWTATDHPRAETLVGRCDVVHGTNFVSPPTTRAREVLTIHDLTYELHAETVSSDSLAYRTLVPRSLRRGATVVCPSYAVAEQVRDFYRLDDHRVRATPLGVHETWFDTPAADQRLRARLHLPERYLLFVGSLDPRKNLARLVQAHAMVMSDSPGTPPLVLAGPAGREASLDGASGLVRTGWLDDADLRAVVAGAQALVLPSLDEGFGLPALEALACGRPVLAADVPALREVTGAHAVLADPLDVQDLARGLLDVLARPDAPADRAARRAHARAWTWAACADATVAAYFG